MSARRWFGGALLLAALGMTAGVAGPSRDAQIVARVGGNLAGRVGDILNVPITVDLTGAPGVRLGGYLMTLRYNPNVLRFESGSNGTFAPPLVNEDSAFAGVLRLTAIQPSGADGVVTLAVGHFVVQSDTGASDITISFEEMSGVAPAFDDLLPLLTVVNGTFCHAAGKWGDVDGDGQANSRDALIALSKVVGIPLDTLHVDTLVGEVTTYDTTVTLRPGLADVDADGQVTSRDALIIVSYAVGLPVPGFRIGLAAAGACGSGLGITLAITPDTLELLTGQTANVVVTGRDGTGQPMSVSGAIWSSGNTAVARAVSPGFGIEARDQGVAVLTVQLGASYRSSMVVKVIAHRTLHWVDPQAAGAQNRLGTQNLPFGSIEEGLQAAWDGDTLRLRLGRYEIRSGTLSLERPVVIIGDTAADGSRPVLAPDSSSEGYYGAAIDIWGRGRFEVQNVAFSGVYTGVHVGEADCVLLRGVRMHTYEYGVHLDSPARCLRIEHSVILGPDLSHGGDAPVVGSPVQRTTQSSAYYYGSGGVTTGESVDTLTIEDTEIAGFYYGVSLGTIPDSTTIRRSSLHDFQEGAVVTNGGCGECSAPNGSAAARPPARVRPAPAPIARSAMDGLSGRLPALVIEWSRLVRVNYGSLVDLEAPFRRVAFKHNVMTNPGRTAVHVDGDDSYGPTGVSGYLSMVGDSIVAPPTNQHYYWLDAGYLDSVTIDSLQVVGAEYGSTHNVALVRMTNSTLRDIRQYGLEVDFWCCGGLDGGVLQLDNDSVIGDPRDDAQVDAFEQYGARVEANRVTVINAYEGIDSEGSDSSVTVTNSLFRHVKYPVYWDMSSYPGPNASTMTVRHSTFDGFSWGVEAYGGRMVVDSNTFENGYRAIYLDTPRPITATGNRISGTEKAIKVYSYDSTTTVTIADNVLSGISWSGIYLDGYTNPDTLQTVFDVRRNTVTCDATGATDAAGIDLSDAHLVVLDNTVSGCYAGIRTVINNNSPRLDSIVGNTVTVPANAEVGIGVTGLALARVGRNTITGAATGRQIAGLIDVSPCTSYACPDNNIPVAVIDSNTVNGGTVWGIHAEWVDSLDVTMNTVTNLNSPSGGYGSYGEDFGGISVMGYLSTFARIIGNVVRNITGNGIVVRHNGTTVSVDSNVVADVDSTGIFFGDGGGGLTLTRNLVTGARRDGIRIAGYGAVTVTGNNIAGNLPYGMHVLADRTVSAPDNWWGDALGPTCVEVCNSLSTGDSVSDGVYFGGDFLSAPNEEAPGLPVPAQRFLAHAVPAPAMRPAGSGDPLDAPFPLMGRHERAPRAQAQRPVPASGAVAATGPVAERRAAQERERTAAAARRAERVQQLRARAEARDRARQAARAAHAPPGAPRSQGVRP